MNLSRYQNDKAYSMTYDQFTLHQKLVGYEDVRIMT